MSGVREDVADRDPIELELYLLIFKFLAKGPCHQTAEVLAEELSKHKLLPKRLDWRGQEHVRSLENLLDVNRHISSEHLLRLCERVVTLLNQDSSITSVPGVKSLLGAGRQSVLRTELDLKCVKWSPARHAAVQHGRALLPPIRLAGNINAVHTVFGRQLAGCARQDHMIGHHTYTHIGLLSRSLGHLSSVYCVMFDRTGKYIITGSDDYLVKVWSAVNGRLLCTFRGHSAEISDIACCYSNRLLAAGSCDKLIRIWCMRTSQPVAVLQGHTHMITSLRFCPYKRGDSRYLASTGGDGCLCVWEYNVKNNKFNTKPIKFIERSRAGTQMLCSTFSPGGIFLATGSSDNVVRVFSMGGVAPEKICELEAHMDRVDTIQYANHDARFLSSSKDGTARIWRFERSEWKAIVLEASQTIKRGSRGDANDNEDALNVSDSRMTERRLRDRSLRLDPNGSEDTGRGDDDVDDNEDDDEKKYFKYQVTMACWTTDDSYVVTAVSDHTLKVWDSHTGHLYRVLKGHKDEVFVLEHNPVDRRILLSAGHDGNIIIWDVTSGARIKTFHNLIEGQGHGAVFDCKWSPDGQSFAATDSHGFLLYFGIGSNEPYKKLPEEVYFHTDYRPLIRDANNYVLDEQTQHPPHAMPPPFLVDIDGNPYSPLHQRLVPGREGCTDTQLVPLVAVTPSGDREVLDDIHGGLQEVSPPDNPPPPEAIGNGVEDRPIIDEMIARMQLVQDQRLAAEAQPITAGSSSQPIASGSSTQPITARSSSLLAPSGSASQSSSNDHSSANQSTDHDYHTRSGRHSVRESRGESFRRTRTRGVESGREAESGSREEESGSRRGESAESILQDHGGENSADGFVDTSRRGDSSVGVARGEDSQQAPPTNMSVWVRRILIREVDPSMDSTASSWRQAMAEEEIKDFMQHRKLKPLTKFEKRSLEVGRRSTSVGVVGTSSGGGWKDLEGVTRNEIIGRNRLLTRALYDTESDEASTGTTDEELAAEMMRTTDGENEDVQSEGEQQQPPAAAAAAAAAVPATRNGASDGESSAYSDWLPDAGENLQPPKRQSQRQVKRKKKWGYRRKSDQSQSSTDEEAEDDDRWAVRPKKNKKKNSGKAPAARKVASPSPKPKLSLKEKQKQRVVSDSERGEVKEVPPDFKPPEWLTSTVPRKAPYFPQMGDEVIYFLQGHQQYVDAVKTRQAYSIEVKKNQPWHKMALREQELLKVVGIKYEIRPPRLVCLKLGFIDPETSRLIGGTFTVKYHDMPDVIDFVVLRQTYEISMQRNWDVRDRFRCLIDDTWWFGTVVSREPFQHLYPDSQFQSLHVQWDNGEFERLSPWDLELISDAVLPSRRGSSVPVNQEELSALAYEPRTHEWPDCGRAEECDRIVRGLEQIMELAIAEPFLVPVDLNDFPIYAVIIEYPIDLNTIKQRLENRFYRRIAAIQYDVRHVESNAREFNKPNSVIVKYARLVTELSLQFIADENCTDVMPLYTHLTKDVNFALNPHPSTSSGGGRDEVGDEEDGDTEEELGDLGEGPSFLRNNSSLNVSNLNTSGLGSSRAAGGRRVSSRGGGGRLSWREGCQRVLEVILDSSDSTPFIIPVDQEQFPNYLEVVGLPMDLETVQSNLQGHVYSSPAEFARDIRLIISNSRLYNTNKRSKIFAMTLRLSALFEEQFKCVLTDYKSSSSTKAAARSLKTSSHSAAAAAAAAAAMHTRRLANRRTGRVRNYFENSDDDDNDDDDANHDDDEANNEDDDRRAARHSVNMPRRLYGSSRLAARSSLHSRGGGREQSHGSGGRNAYRSSAGMRAATAGSSRDISTLHPSQLSTDSHSRRVHPSTSQNGSAGAPKSRRIRTRGATSGHPLLNSSGSVERIGKGRLEHYESTEGEEEEEVDSGRDEEEPGGEGEVTPSKRKYRRRGDSDDDFVVGRRPLKKSPRGKTSKYGRHKIKNKSRKISGSTRLDDGSRSSRQQLSNGHHSNRAAGSASQTRQKQLRGSEGYSTRCATGSIKRKHYDRDLDLDTDNEGEETRSNKRRRQELRDSSDDDGVVSRRAGKRPLKSNKVNGASSHQRAKSLPPPSTPGSEEHNTATSGGQSSSSSEDDDEGDNNGEKSGNDTEAYSEHSGPVIGRQKRRVVTRDESSPERGEEEEEDWNVGGGRQVRKTNRMSSKGKSSCYGTRNRGQRTVVYHEDSDDEAVARHTGSHSNRAVAKGNGRLSDDTEEEEDDDDLGSREKSRKRIIRRS